MKRTSIVVMLALGAIALSSCKSSKPGDGGGTQPPPAPDYSASITRVMKAYDECLAEAPKPQKQSLEQTALGMRWICERLELVNTSDCPPDYRHAFTFHTEAYRKTFNAINNWLRLLDAAHDAEAKVKVIEAMNSAASDMAEGISSVISTQESLIRVAAKYGVFSKHTK